MPDPPRLLAGQRGYACRHTGVCCSSGWEIGVEVTVHRRIEDAILGGRLRPVPGGALQARPNLPPGQTSVLARHDGRCVFRHEAPAGCELHAVLGAAGKPSACRQFPYVTVHDPRGTYASLSHYCPTAARMLCDEAPLVVIEASLDIELEGLDVRAALPPAARGDLLLDWDALTAWETAALRFCSDGSTPEQVLERLRRLFEHVGCWRRAGGSLAAWIDAAATRIAGEEVAARTCDPALDAIVRAAIPARLDAPPPFGEQYRGPGDDRLLVRYLAARLIACWPLHFGIGLTTQLAYVEALIAVLRAEIARRLAAGCDRRTAYLEAVRETDRLVVHLADPQALADGLDMYCKAGEQPPGATARRSSGTLPDRPSACGRRSSGR